MSQEDHGVSSKIVGFGNVRTESTPQKNCPKRIANWISISKVDMPKCTHESPEGLKFTQRTTGK